MAPDSASAATPEEVRQQAEQISRDRAEKQMNLRGAHMPQDVGELVHELRVHQIELEMQNEQLRQTQLDLEAARDSYLDLYDHAPVSYLSISAQGLILQANLTAAHALKLERDMLIARPFTSFIAPESQDHYYLHTRQIGQPGAAQAVELQLINADHARFWAWVETARAKSPDDAALFHITFSDISDRKQIEAELVRERALLEQHVAARTHELSVANADLVRSNRIKEQFLATMSHELRTPLSAILAFAESLLEDTYGPINDQQQRVVRIIQISGRDLLTQIDDMIDFARMSAGKPDLVIESVRLADVILAIERLIVPLAQQHMLAAEFSIDPTVTFLKTDARRLKQLLLNLLLNAVKFTPAGGTIGLSLTNRPTQQAIECQVWDTGIGIAPTDFTRLFTPFAQLDSGLSRRHEGIGLGLALTSQIVDLFGGSITVVSEIGLGSRFTVTLPWSSADPRDIYR
jgi:PAS domain S-box-containing protein